MNTQFEKLGIRHLHAVRELAARSFPRLWSPQDFAYFLAHDLRVALGIRAEGSDVSLRAYFLALLIQGDLDIISLATEPTARRRGWAGALISEACRQPGVERAFLEVAVENAPAIALYEKLGFKTLHRRREYYDSHKDALVMRWERPTP